MWTRFWNRCVFLFRRRRFDRELCEELDFHREMLQTDIARAGVTPSDAARAARRQFGSALTAREDARVPWRSAPMRAGLGLAADARDALRGLRAGRGITLVALLILTMGIAAGTVTFSVVDALALRPLPYREPEQLTSIARLDPHEPGYSVLAPQDYFAIEQRVLGLDGVAGAGGWVLPGTTHDSAPIIGARTTANYFDVLGVAPRLGRGFRPGDNTPGRDAVIVLSHQFWMRDFGGDPHVVGRRVTFGKDTREVVGVMAEDFAFWTSGKAAEFWVPWVPTSEDRSEASPGRSHFLQVFGRRRLDVSLDQLQTQLVAARKTRPSFDQDSRFMAVPLADLVLGSAKSWLLLTLAAIGLVLLASCVNVASLLLTRGTMRKRELATREALGASRGRLARALLFEGLLLAVMSAAAGIGISYWGVAATKALLPQGLARVREIAVDGRVLSASVCTAMLCGLIFGAAPALQIARRDLTTAIKDDGSNVIGGRWRGRWLGACLIAQVAFVVMLLVGTGLVLATFIQIVTMDLGFERRNVLTVSVSRQLAGVPRDQRNAAADAFVNDVLARASAVPGVLAAGVVRNGVPMSGSWARYSLKLPNGVETAGDFTFHPATPGYFAAMGVRLERGRIFTDADRLGAPSVAIVNDVAARRFFAGSDPVGQVVTFAGPTTIVGVVSGTHVQGPEAAVQPELYVPLSQRLPVEGGAYGDLVIRVATLTPDVQARVSAAIAPVLQGGKSSEAMSIDTLFEKLTAQRRFTASVLSVFGLVAAVIAAIGIYGVIAFLVSQQTREIGLRMALGASSQSVLMAVLGRAARYVAIGVVIGLAGAWAMSGLFTSLVFGVTPTDPRVYLSAAAFLLVVALVAALAPARRAARIDPLVALRAD